MTADRHRCSATVAVTSTQSIPTTSTGTATRTPRPAVRGDQRAAPQLRRPRALIWTRWRCRCGPAPLTVADGALRCFAGFLDQPSSPTLTGFVDVRRAPHRGVQELAWSPGSPPKATPAGANTIRQRLGTLRTFFDRIIEWDWPDAPARTPIFSIDVPVADDPLPRFLDDVASHPPAPPRSPSSPTRCDRPGRRAVGPDRDARRRALRPRADAVWSMTASPGCGSRSASSTTTATSRCTPTSSSSSPTWPSTHHDAVTGLLLTRDGRPLEPAPRQRIVNRVAAAAGLGHVHPHQLRHTLATQAINRGMRLEAIAAMLGHRSLRMTIIYARIANRTVADEYHAVSATVDALYADTDLAGQETPAMRQLRRAPPHARQRLVHPTPRPRLQLRNDLRRLRLLRDHHRVRTHPPSPTRPRRHPRPARPSRALPTPPQHHRMTSPTDRLELSRTRPITGITRPPLTGSPA